MDRQQIAQLHEKASEHYLRGEFRDALEAWQSLLAIDPGDEQAMEGVRLAAMLVETREPQAPQPPPPVLSRIAPADLRRRLDEVDARIEAGDLRGAVDSAEKLAAQAPSESAVTEAVARARRALEIEPFVLEHLARAKAGVAAGRLGEAAAACRKVLSVDAHHLEAANLLRQCENAPRDGDPLDGDLKVLDALSTRLDGAKRAADAPAPSGPVGDPPARASAAGAKPHAAATAGPAPAPATAGAQEDKVIEPPPAPAAPSAAAEELKRRVEDLLEEAKREATAERIDEALGILSRVFILDEQNEQALTLEQELRTAQGNSSRDVENWLAEAVQDFEAGRLEEARSLLQKVLQRYPSHLEAVDYLERIDAAQAAQERGPAPSKGPEAFQGEDLLSAGSRLEAADLGAPQGPRTMTGDSNAASIPLQRASGAASGGALAREEAGIGDEVSAPPLASAPPRSSLPWPIVAGLAVVVVAATIGAAVWKLPTLLHGKSAPPAAGARPEASARPAPSRREIASSPKPPVVPTSKSVPEAMARGKSAMEAGDFATAVVAYNDALALDPGLDEARAGLSQAGERYKAQKAERDQIDRAKAAFDEGEFTPALKILYRLPQGRYAAEIEHYKANAWYNLGLVSLRAGNCKEAQESFDETLQINPGDPDVRRAKELARRYQGLEKDRAFYDLAESIPFRKMNE
jgi:tetratricopeptide (TPR) repeat protein